MDELAPEPLSPEGENGAERVQELLARAAEDQVNEQRQLVDGLREVRVAIADLVAQLGSATANERVDAVGRSVAALGHELAAQGAALDRVFAPLEGTASKADLTELRENLLAEVQQAEQRITRHLDQAIVELARVLLRRGAASPAEWPPERAERAGSPPASAPMASEAAFSAPEPPEAPPAPWQPEPAQTPESTGRPVAEVPGWPPVEPAEPAQEDSQLPTGWQLPAEEAGEPSPAEPTPAEPTPAEATPAEPRPAESRPAEPTPAEPEPEPAQRPAVAWADPADQQRHEDEQNLHEPWFRRLRTPPVTTPPEDPTGLGHDEDGKPRPWWRPAN